MSKPEPKPSIVDLILKDEKAREENCKVIVEKALKEFNCSLEGSIVINQRGNFPTVTIKANPVK